ncbi:MAG: transposase, partial [Marmoricola sp.]
SFRSELVASTDKRARADVREVRVIEYLLDDKGRPAAAGTTYRLITTVLDPAAAPADELAALYAERWEIESVFDELKTHQRGPRVVLRSRTPLHAARRSVRTGLTGAVTLTAALRRAVSELLHGLLPVRRLRANARVVRRKMSNYNVKCAAHRNWPNPSRPAGSAIRIVHPP